LQLSFCHAALDYTTIDLPVKEIIKDVQIALEAKNTLIVSAPPGAGKSTLLPLCLLDQPWLQGQKILMLEPRRLATKTIAQRMAELWGDELGQTIGYRVRFESRVSATTKIEVLTEGILTRMLHSDNALEGVGMVIFDEFHERSLHADVALALCRESQQLLRPDIRILIMSATLNLPKLSSLLDAPVIESQGRQYPVELRYMGATDEQFLPETTARIVVQAANEHQGDILVFLPGEGEIRKCAEILEKSLSSFAIHPLYGQLPPNQQFAAIMPNRFGKRKVVLATSIAETSLTIEGVKIVVDSGFGKTSRFDPSSGLSKLQTIQISKDSADQRAGRAGRLSPGFCYRMWSLADHQRLADHRVPEIMEADLTPLVLDMAHWGVRNISDLIWLTEPPKASVLSGNETLHQLSALDEDKITPHGKDLHRLACHPRIAHMLIMAQSESSKQLACDIAAILEERDPLGRESGIDINLRIEALRRNRSRKSIGKRMTRIAKIAESYRRMLQLNENNEAVDPFETGLLLAYAYPERIASARPGNNAQFQLANGKLAQASYQDDLANEPWLAVAHMDMREGIGKIFLAAPLNPRDLMPLVKEKEILIWDTRKGGLQASKDLRIGSIVLQSKPLPNPNPDLVSAAISKAIAQEGNALLNFDDAFEQLQLRILSLKHWNPEQSWPDVSSEALLNNNADWLAGYLDNIKKPEDLKKIPLKEALLNFLGWDFQQTLERLAPEKIIVPTGSSIRIQYLSNGGTPILAVRLQELFGVSDTPKINDNKTGVVLHLLSPGYKPVQVTSDLRSFWNTTYFEVKKELKRRYPKHAWPDDPWMATPVAKGRPMK
jgi:ATP-dependent helicase HrpB